MIKVAIPTIHTQECPDHAHQQETDHEIQKRTNEKISVLLPADVYRLRAYCRIGQRTGVSWFHNWASDRSQRRIGSRLTSNRH